MLQSMGSQRVRHIISVKGKTEKVNVVMRQRLEDRGNQSNYNLGGRLPERKKLRKKLQKPLF